MEVWRADTGERPEVVSSRNLLVALALHILFGLLLYAYSVFNFHSDEKIIPIDLTVVVNENLDGVENEPPPLDDPPPPPKPQPKPKPKPAPVKKPDPPKALEQIVTNVVVSKVEKKEEPKKEEPKKKEPKKPEPPKKTAKELREERLKRMRSEAKVSNKKVEIKVKGPSGNGRTAKKTLSNAEIMKLLNQGYKPGTSEQLATSEAQLCYSLIKQAFEAKWDRPPWTDTLRPMTIRVWFGPGGRIVKYKLESSSGDAKADQTIKTAAGRVGAVPQLLSGFIEQYRSSGVPVRFTVKPQ